MTDYHAYATIAPEHMSGLQIGDQVSSPTELRQKPNIAPRELSGTNETTSKKNTPPTARL